MRDEEWRFTNVSPVVSREYAPAAPAVALTPAQIERLPFGSATHRVVVVNGRFSSELSRLKGLATGVRAGLLAGYVNGELQADSEFVQRYLGSLADYTDRAFAALNTAHLDDGAYVYVPDGVVLRDPLHILFVSANGSGAQPAVTYPRCPDCRWRSKRSADRRDLRRNRLDLLHERRDRSVRR